MLKREKERVVADLVERLRASDTLIVADYRGLTMPEIDGVRTEVLKHGARFTVVKNTLTKRAAEEAGVPGDLEPERFGVVVGTGVGGLETMERETIAWHERGPRAVSPHFVPMMMPNAAAALVAMRGGFTGPNLCVTTACAAGAHAIGEAARMVRDGSVDVAIGGGAASACVVGVLALSH